VTVGLPFRDAEPGRLKLLVLKSGENL